MTHNDTKAAAMTGPEGPVRRQLDAYNDHDVERFIAEYTDDVTVYRPPSTEPVLSGKNAFAEHYAKNRFTLPDLHAKIVNRMIVGNRVVDHEHIVGLPDGPREAIAVYEVVGDRIRTVWFF